jgi:serine/threonine protein kinase
MNYVASIPASEVVEAAMALKCPVGHDIPADAPMGLCPECMYGVALEAPRDSTQFGGYELLEKIARGGMGIVYKAKHTRTGRIEALKMILGGELASDAEVHRFLFEAKAASELDHPNIVPIYQVGEEDGRHYFTMKWIRGGNLADHIDRYRGDPRGAAEFVETIAMVVHYGHDHGILHRDLKPANILLDDEGKPHVADFGLAKRLEHHDKLHTHPGLLAGSPPYMAPEQADGKGKPPTRAVDVYSLGVILFELLTGKPPFEGATAGEIIEQVLHRAPPDPRSIDPRIDLDVVTICLRCLEKDPANRYHSAIELARDLRRYLDGDPIRPVGPFKRSWNWCKRRPLMAALIVESALLLVVATLAVFSGAAAQEKDRREEVLRANEYAARWVAGTVLFKLSGYRDAVAKAATDFPPELFEKLRRSESREGDRMEAYCKELRSRYSALDSGQAALQDWFILGKDGVTLARITKVPNYSLGMEYAWRDYFKGAWKLGEARSRSAYISRAILSEPNQSQRYVISAPIYDEKNEPIGVIITTTDTGAALGTLELKDPSDKRHIAMVVAPRDNNRDTRNNPLPEDHVILIHDSLVNGKTTMLKSNAAVHAAVALAERSNPNRGLSQLLLTDPSAVTFDENFCDPVMDGSCEDESGKPHAGRWLAGFAPIGNTGFVAIVETPRDAAAQPNQTLARRLLLWGVLPFMLGTALVAGVVGVGRRRSKRAASRGTILRQ